MESKEYKCRKDYIMECAEFKGVPAFIEGRTYKLNENRTGKSELFIEHDLSEERFFDEYFEPVTPIQSPDADNTERGERPKIKDFFPESFGLMDILPIYESQPELFNYAKALDRYITELEDSTPPTLLNELRENADKRAIEFAEWISSEFWILSSDDLWYQKSDGNIYSGISTAELLKQFHNRPL